jgi:hypothetical protein
MKNKDILQRNQKKKKPMSEFYFFLNIIPKFLISITMYIVKNATSKYKTW